MVYSFQYPFRIFNRLCYFNDRPISIGIATWSLLWDRCCSGRKVGQRGESRTGHSHYVCRTYNSQCNRGSHWHIPWASLQLEPIVSYGRYCWYRRNGLYLLLDPKNGKILLCRILQGPASI